MPCSVSSFRIFRIQVMIKNFLADNKYLLLLLLPYFIFDVRYSLVDDVFLVFYYFFFNREEIG